jgi:hypothetical protein
MRELDEEVRSLESLHGKRKLSLYVNDDDDDDDNNDDNYTFCGKIQEC